MLLKQMPSRDPDHAARPAAVVDDHRLPPRILKSLPDQSRDDIGAAARRRRHDELNRPLRIGLRGGDAAQRRDRRRAALRRSLHLLPRSL